MKKVYLLILALVCITTVQVFAQTFTDATTTAPGLTGVKNGYISWGDYDNDGDLDFFITGNQTADLSAQIWRNGTTGTSGSFTNVTASVAPNLQGVYIGSVKWGDYDNDGDLDFILTGNSYAGRISQIWRNGTTGTMGIFTNVTSATAPGLQGVLNGVADWADYDKDGDLDFMITGDTGAGLIAQIWKNNGTGGFSNVTAVSAPGLPGVQDGSMSPVDYDKDGDPDFLITGTSSTGGISQLWKNGDTGHPGTYVNVTASVFSNLPGVKVSSVSWGDYDNDGDPDLLFTGDYGVNYAGSIYRNDVSANGLFTEVTTSVAPGLTLIGGSSVSWGDYDNDGDLDFLHTGSNGYGRYTQIWNNNGSNFFSDVTAALFTVMPGQVSSSSAGWADYDNDGDLDFLLTGNTDNGRVAQLWKNQISVANTRPTSPGNLVSVVGADNISVTLNWTPSSDNQSPPNALTYNVYLSEVQGKTDKLSPMASLPTGYRRIVGAGIYGNSYTITGLDPGKTYYWSVQAIDQAFAGGAFAPEKSFSLNPEATISAAGPTTFCSGGSVVLSTVSASSYRWFRNGQPISNQTQASYTATQSGDYTVELTFANGFKKTSAITKVTVINVNAAIVALGNTTISKGSTIQLLASGGTTYSWQPANGLTTTNVPNPFVRPSQTTTYRVNVSNGTCSELKEITIIVVEDYQIVANNIITPNGDGFNDTWSISNLDFYPKNEVKIFDRTGRIVYSKKGYVNEWDGTSNGQPLAEDTYFYFLDFGPGIGKIKGSVTLIRNQK